MVSLDSALLLEGLVNTKFTNLSWKLQEMPVVRRQIANTNASRKQDAKQIDSMKTNHTLTGYVLLIQQMVDCVALR